MKKYTSSILALLYLGGALSACGHDFVTVPDLEESNFSGQAPSELSASTATPYGVSLYWQDNANIETSFHVQRREVNEATTADTPYDTIGVAAVNQEWFPDQEVVTATTYEYRVAARQGTVTIGESETTQVRIPVYAPSLLDSYALPLTPDTVFDSPLDLPGERLLAVRQGSRVSMYYLSRSRIHGPISLNGADNNLTNRLISVTFSEGNIVVATVRNDVNDVPRMQLVRYLRYNNDHDIRVTSDNLWADPAIDPDYVVVLLDSEEYLHVISSGYYCIFSTPPGDERKKRCADPEEADKIQKPVAGWIFDDRILISTESGSKVADLSLFLKDGPKVVRGNSNAPVYTRFWSLGGNVYGKHRGGIDIFRDIDDLNDGRGQGADASTNVDAPVFWHESSGDRTTFIGCNQDIEVFAGSRLLDTVAYTACPVWASLYNQSRYISLTEDGQLQLYDLGPRWGTWTEQ